jgi:hypothetical protein
MGQKTVRFSDLSGQLILREDALARIVIQEHPELGDGPVEIEALADEALAMEKDALRVAVLDLYLPGEDLPRRVTLGAEAFDALVTEKPAGEMLAGARPVKRAGRPRRVLAAASAKRISRATPARTKALPDRLCGPRQRYSRRPSSCRASPASSGGPG